MADLRDWPSVWTTRVKRVLGEMGKMTDKSCSLLVVAPCVDSE